MPGSFTPTPAQLRALRFLAGRDYGIPSQIGYAIAEDRSKRGKSGMVPQGAGRLGGTTATALVRLGYASHSTRRDGFAAYAITPAGRALLERLA